MLRETHIHEKYAKCAILEKIVRLRARTDGCNEQQLGIALDDFTKRGCGRSAVGDYAYTNR